MQKPSIDKKIAMVILAAGTSSRMKAIKQLLPWKKTTLLGNTIEQGLSIKIDTVFVILGANKEKILPTIKKYNITIIENEDWELGLGKSIASAVEFLNNYSTQFDGILIALADQPLLTEFHYDELIAKFSKSDFGIVATRQKTSFGVPAVFDEKYFEKLVMLKEDRGAKTIIKENMGDVYFVDADGNALDIDITYDYEKIYKKYGI